MNKMTLIGIAMLVINNSLFGYTQEEIASALKRQAQNANIDVKILYTIAKIESGFRPHIISFVNNTREIKIGGVNMSISPYGKKFIVNLSGNPQNLIKTAKMLIKDGFLIDVGIMQINSQNFKVDEIEKMFELDYNIEKAASILKLCQNKYENTHRIIECYNKGYRKKETFNYFNRFKQSFLKDFAGVRL